MAFGIVNRLEVGRPRKGTGPPKSCRRGGLPCATPGLSPWAKCDSLLQKEECQGLALPPAPLTPMLAWPASHLWPAVGTGVDPRM